MAMPLSSHLALTETISLSLSKLDVHVRKGRSIRIILLVSVVLDIDLVVRTVAAILLLNAYMLYRDPLGGSRSFTFSG